MHELRYWPIGIRPLSYVEATCIRFGYLLMHLSSKQDGSDIPRRRKSCVTENADRRCVCPGLLSGLAYLSRALFKMQFVSFCSPLVQPYKMNDVHTRPISHNLTLFYFFRRNNNEPTLSMPKQSKLGRHSSTGVMFCPPLKMLLKALVVIWLSSASFAPCCLLWFCRLVSFSWLAAKLRAGCIKCKQSGSRCKCRHHMLVTFKSRCKH